MSPSVILVLCDSARKRLLDVQGRGLNSALTGPVVVGVDDFEHSVQRLSHYRRYDIAFIFFSVLGDQRSHAPLRHRLDAGDTES